MFAKLAEGLKTFIFPDNCLLCRRFLNSRHQRQLCPACLSTIKMNTPPFCPRCGRHTQEISIDDSCKACKGHAYGFDIAWSACLYAEPMDKLLHAFKYHSKTALRKTFRGLMHSFIEQYHIPIEGFDLILPIPLHPARLRERGFNQSEALALSLSEHYRIPLARNIMERPRHTGTQASLQAKQRWTNMAGAFRINRPSEVADKSILIVDDLLTTGATAHAAAGALKEAGAAHVGILTLAITEQHAHPA